MKGWRVEFPGTACEPVELADLCALSEVLNEDNSPLLFGCRRGLCGTCLIEVEATGGARPDPPTPEEAESLSLFAPDNPRARLACQIHICADMRISKLANA